MKLVPVATALARLAATSLFAVSLANAQVPFPQNYPNAPTGKAKQDVFPYPGQCWTVAPIGDLPRCSLANARSFACEPSGSGFPNQTAGGWGTCGAVTKPALVNPVDPTQQTKFQFELLNPIDYTPDQTKFTGADYYELAVHEAWGFQGVASAGLFPDPTKFSCGAAACPPVPNGQQWTGIVVNGVPKYTPIFGVGQKNVSGGPVTQVLTGAGLFKPPAKSPEWSKNNFVATWPSISVRGTTGRPVVVKWVNEFPNNHLFCSHPEAADWPCAIDRTFMGVKAAIDPATAPLTFQLGGLPYNGVNQFGSAQQPDNSWVTHLHGGEIPPETDGFAEKWFGNVRSGRYYSPQPWLLNPAFNAPFGALPDKNVLLQRGAIFRPGGDPALSLGNGESSWSYDTYAYPMVNDEATIWFHDHTLGKTHHNVVAGPAGFFPVKDPARHNRVLNRKCVTATGAALPSSACDFTWIDPVTEPRAALGVPKYDLFLAVQDRSFNDDGTLNFPNGMAQPLTLPVALPADLPGAAGVPTANSGGNSIIVQGLAFAPGTTPVTPGANPQVHPVWVPEYIGDHALVNGVIWPKRTVEPGWYRIRIVDGSDARCYNLTFGTAQGTGNGLGLAARGFGQQGPDEANVPFYALASDQGYIPTPALTDHVLMCPGERFEILVDFSAFAGKKIYMNNNAAGPFPDGVAPQDAGSPFTELATIMMFDVGTTGGVKSCAGGRPANSPFTCLAIPGTAGNPPKTDSTFTDIRSLPSCPGQVGQCVAAERVLFLNEQLDTITGAPLGLQINGVPFEYDVTETPRKGTYETWHIVNTTGDAHPMHPHLVKHQIVKRETFDVGCYKTLLCGSPDCRATAAPGNVPTLTPDYHQCLTPSVPSDFTTEAAELGWKDVARAYPGEVLTIVAKWDGRWKQPTAAGGTVDAPGAGSSSNPGFTFYAVGQQSPKIAASWVYPEVTSGPYVWHCHINSHEDSEMMRSSLVVK